MPLGRRKPRFRVFSAGRRSLTAAGTRVGAREGERLRHTRQPWQARAFYHYDELGAIKYASQFYSRPLSKLRLFAAEVDDQGELEETENPEVIAQLERIQDPGGGRSQLLSAYGRLAFLVGEALLFVSDNAGEEEWEFLSTDELRVEPGEPTRYMRIRAPSLGQEEFTEPGPDDYSEVKDSSAIAYRIWNRHPRFSHLADSPMRGVLDICDELLILTRAIRATARSRIAKNGLLLLPDGISAPPPAGSVPDEDPEEDPVMSALIEAMTAAIVDEESASALAPLLLRGDPDALKEIRHLALVEPTLLYPEIGVRAELINRLAIELDMPPEALLGNQQSNHWQAWLVDEQSWKDHQEPVAKRLVDDLTAAFFRPTLRELDVKDWQRYRIAYDATDVVVHPDRTKDAKDLHDRIVLSDAAYREAAGFHEEDAPPEEEVNRRIGILTRDSSLAVYGIPQVRGIGIEADPGVVEDPAHPVDATETVKAAPPEQAPAEQVVAGSLEAARIVGAAQLALLRAREKAGARLRSLSKRDPEAEKLIEGVPATKIAHALGVERAAKLKAPDARELVAGATELLREALTACGVEDEQTATFLGEQIERHAARTLFEENPGALPSGVANFILDEITKRV